MPLSLSLAIPVLLSLFLYPNCRLPYGPSTCTASHSIHTSWIVVSIHHVFRFGIRVRIPRSLSLSHFDSCCVFYYSFFFCLLLFVILLHFDECMDKAFTGFLGDLTVRHTRPYRLSLHSIVVRLNGYPRYDSAKTLHKHERQVCCCLAAGVWPIFCLFVVSSRICEFVYFS